MNDNVKVYSTYMEGFLWDTKEFELTDMDKNVVSGKLLKNGTYEVSYNNKVIALRISTPEKFHRACVYHGWTWILDGSSYNNPESEFRDAIDSALHKVADHSKEMTRVQINWFEPTEYIVYDTQEEFQNVLKKVA